MIASIQGGTQSTSAPYLRASDSPPAAPASPGYDDTVQLSQGNDAPDWTPPSERSMRSLVNPGQQSATQGAANLNQDVGAVDGTVDFFMDMAMGSKTAVEEEQAEHAGDALQEAGTLSKAVDGADLVLGPVSGVFGGIQVDQGINELGQARNAKQTASGALDVASGSATVVGSGAGTLAGLAGFGVVGGAGLAEAAGGVALGAGGVAAAADGIHDIINAKNNYDLGVGIAKTAGGAALTAGTALDATGVGAVVGVPLQVAGVVTVAGAYLAQTGVGHDVVHAVGQAGSDLINAGGQVAHDLNPLNW